jgi:3-deoxy-manno-octulosonate cytidylyltransferase (CMP-KDO synthetase)
MSFVVVSPARYASTRLPGKPLLDIGGKPMIQWVVDAAAQSKASAIWVATDDERIASAVRNPRGQDSIALLTRAEHPSGTDRIAEVAVKLKLSADTIVVNVQGDEPKLPSALIDQVAELLIADPQAAIATLSTPITHLDEFLDPNAVKVVSTYDGVALYFSRAPIPWSRDGATAGLSSQTQWPRAQRHLGIYAYRVAALLQMTALPFGELEQIEKLEQLRAMQAGLRIRVAEANVQPGIGVDTPADLEKIRKQ